MKNIDVVLKEALEYSRKYIDKGNVATYIPELAKVDKNMLGASIVTVEGKRYHIGDCQHEFTMQSISKTIALIYALEHIGSKIVFSKVGMEPSGDPFNSMAKLETKDKYPSNPFINAGAITVAGLIADKYEFEDYLAFTRRLCGRDSIEVDENVYKSESETGMLNRSMAFFMKNNGIIETDVEKTLEFYFKMCSVKVNTDDLSNYASILSYGGVEPKSGIRLIDKEVLIVTKSLMATCGMYDGSGEFAIRVGMPAKSGVGGGIIASAENKMGISVFGPALDVQGNSIGGYHFLEYLSKELGLHYFSGELAQKYRKKVI
ncbi:glutaminase A [Tissierella sp. Yu-01]|uniref:glutaminase A n=1 Tax=Tissierella sp. Yu-01 TaxID=3035694 RepID=UPI00240D6379|nr:glutaminase A [Tissierella sp. Yu-01]WFA08736.1 glutaminase A [Tissierella sp. Yu-01]